MNNKICISLPVKSGNVQDNVKTIKKALKYHPNFIELRFDYIDQIEAINPDLTDSLLKIIKPYCPVIYTFRDFSEGGQFQVDEKDRLDIQKSLIKSKPDYIDLEMETKEQMLKQLIPLASLENVKLIFSHHDLKSTPLYEDAQNYLNKFIDKLKDIVMQDFDIVDQYVFKMIFTAEKFIDNLVPLNLCNNLHRNNLRIISFCMGTIGTFSRIFCTKFGSFLTYGSLEKETAPGQLKIEKIRKIHDDFFRI
jgi:3-dehydroquinate dehydratase/shikimate dehydrogenase